MKCNYDSWTTPVKLNMTSKMLDTLRVMADGKVRSRSDMLNAANIEPNPRSKNGHAGFEGTDYYLYRNGYILCTAIVSGRKQFKISAKGRRALNEQTQQTS